MKATIIGMASAIVLWVAGHPAQAGPIQFAQFGQTTGSPLSLTNNSSSATLSYNSSTQVSFSFSAASGADTTARTAAVSLTSSPTFAPAGSSGGTLDEPLNNPLILKFTEVGGPNPGANLLTMTFTGDITGASGATTGSILGSDAGKTVAYTSDFLNFTAPGNSFLLGLTGISPGLSSGLGGFLSSFTANVSGQFTANVTPNGAVPEPSSLALCGLAGLIGLAWTRSRRGRPVA